MTALAMHRQPEERAAIEALQAAEGFSEEEILRDKLADHLKEPGITQTQVAKAIGMSPATVSDFLNGKYPNPKAVVKKLRAYFSTLNKSRAERVELPEEAETKVFQDVTTIINYAHNHQDIGVIYGPAGIGKTTALRAYQEMTPQTIFLTANQTISGSKALLEEILYALNKPEVGTTRRMMKTIVEVLKGSNRLMIIDEAQHLSYRALETLRAIYDECRIGLVLAGNESIYGNMTGRGAAPFAQLLSRVGIRRSLSGRISLADIEKLLGGELDSNCIAFLHKVALGVGSIRGMIKLYKLAKTIANAEGVSIEMSHLTAAQDFMMQRVN